MPQGNPGATASGSRDANRPTPTDLASSATAPSQQQQQENGRGRTLTYEDLASFFNLPINAAAKELGVCVTALKKQCRKHGVQRWPHRKLKSLDKLKEKLEKEEATAADKEYYKHELHSITQKKDHIFRSSSANPANTTALPSAPPMPHIPTPASALHPRPAQLVMGRPMSHFHPAPQLSQKGSSPHIASHYATAQPRSPALVAASAAPMDTDHHQHQQHIIATPLIMPFAQMSGTPPAAMQGPNGTLITHAPPGTQQYSMCGIFGCDCYMNNGVSSRMFHAPIPAVRHAGTGTHSTPNAAVPAGVHYFNAAPYAYAPSMPQMQPYQNMVRVNMVEQPAFPHTQGRPSSTQPASTPANSGVNSSGCQSQPMAHRPTKSSKATAPFECFGTPHPPNGAPNGFVYNTFMPQNVHYDGMMAAHQGNTASTPAYWSDMQHQQAPSNMVTMCNQTVHHHHHHGTETAVTSSPVIAQGNSGRRQGADDTSSRTNNSNVHGQTTSSAVKEKSAKDAAGMSVDMQNSAKPVDTDKPKQPDRMDVDTTSHKLTSVPIMARIKNNGVQSASAPLISGCKNDANRSKPSSSTQDDMLNKSSSSQTQSGSKSSGGVLEASTPNGVHANNCKGDGGGSIIGTDRGSAETSSYSGSGVQEKRKQSNTTSEYPRRSKRARTQLASERKTTPSVRCSEDQVKYCNRSHGGTGVIREQQTSTINKQADAEKSSDPVRDKSNRDRKWNSTNGAASSSPANGKPSSCAMVPNSATLFDRARRFDHVVQQCVGLQSAQWCTDLSFKVTLALGPKSMLALAGVPSLGKSVLDGTETALEDRNTTKNKYAVVAKGQRLEWITAKGSSRYLIVMNPFRRRKQIEICGVSGIMVELKIIQALPK